ncbi:hypothetical protein VN0045_10170 [Helicobacter pylori]
MSLAVCKYRLDRTFSKIKETLKTNINKHKQPSASEIPFKGTNSVFKISCKIKNNNKKIKKRFTLGVKTKGLSLRLAQTMSMGI